MENELILTGMFLGAGLMGYVVIPGMLVMCGTGCSIISGQPAGIPRKVTR